MYTKINDKGARDKLKGSDSKLELIQYKGAKYVIKTFQKHDYDKTDLITRKNRELYYSDKLRELSLPAMTYYDFNWLNDNQLCMSFLDDLKIFSEQMTYDDFFKLANLKKFIIRNTKRKNTQLVTKNGSINKPIQSYFDLLRESLSDLSIETKYIELGYQILNQIEVKTEYLTLLHSDFHCGNIGLVDNSILIFDPGNCMYLYGHKFHDITRQLMYFPEGIIFSEEKAYYAFQGYLDNISEFVKDSEFMNFCYIQSLILTGNPFVKRNQEITTELFSRLAKN